MIVSMSTTTSIPSESLRRIDLNVEDLNLIVYSSPIATRVTLRSSPIEQDVAIAQKVDGKVAVSFIGTKDNDLNRKIAGAVRAIAEHLRTQLTEVSLDERNFLGALRSMPNPTLPQS